MNLLGLARNIKPSIRDHERVLKKTREDRDRFMATSTFRAQVGRDYINAIFFHHIIMIKGKGNISFYDVLNSYHGSKRLFNSLRPSFHRYMNSMKGSIEKKMWQAFKLSYQSFAPFRLADILMLLNRYQPKRMLNPCQGWGVSLVAAIFAQCDYVGIDSNFALQTGYARVLCELLPESERRRYVNICSDALDVDYSQFSYDFVFCSPPFYNTEVYEHMPYSELTKEQYDTDFYEPLFL